MRTQPEGSIMARRKKSGTKAQPVSKAVAGLPTEKKAVVKDIGLFTWLLYGREKIGKTTVMASWPDAIFFTTEPGTKGMSIFEYNHEEGGITDWQKFKDGVKLLEDNPDHVDSHAWGVHTRPNPSSCMFMRSGRSLSSEP